MSKGQNRADARLLFTINPQLKYDVFSKNVGWFGGYSISQDVQDVQINRVVQFALQPLSERKREVIFNLSILMRFFFNAQVFQSVPKNDEKEEILEP